MGAIDRPTPAEPAAADPERLELVRVGRRDGWRPAVALILALAVVVGVAIWKPWSGGAAARPGGTASALLPSSTAGPGPTHAADPTPRPSRVTFAALDLALMGTADPHVGWGVAVAYVSQRQFDVANDRGAETVTPVVSWELIEPSRPGPASRLDHPAVTSVAIAATWPRGTVPRLVRLFFTPPGGSGPREEIALGPTLWSLLRDPPVEASEPAVRSGDFFLPAPIRPDRPADWLANGWPAGTYVFDVDIGPGVRKTLPFILGLAVGS